MVKILTECSKNNSFTHSAQKSISVNIFPGRWIISNVFLSVFFIWCCNLDAVNLSDKYDGSLLFELIDNLATTIYPDNDDKQFPSERK